MRGPRGGAKAAPSSPSVAALAAIAARKAAKMEKSLNKIPAMQIIADQLAKEVALKACQSAAGSKALLPQPSTTAEIEMVGHSTSAHESASSTNPEEVIAKEVPAPALSSTHVDQDIDMVDADLLADFDLDSGSEKEFFLEQLRIAPPEEVDMLLSSLKRAVKPAHQANAPPTVTHKIDDATRSLLQLEVAAFAHKRAAAIPQGILTKEQLNNFKEEVYMYGTGLDLGETQALLAASKAEADLLKARGIRAIKKQLTLPEPPLKDISKTIEHFIKIQEAVGELVKDLPQPQTEAKPASDISAFANKRKRGGLSKGAAGMPHESTATTTEAVSKRQKTSLEVLPMAPSVATEEQVVPSSDPPKLTRKQKQELYRQELEKKRPVIAKKVTPATASAVPALEKESHITPAVLSPTPPVADMPAQQPPSTAAHEPVQKTRQRGRKSAAQKQLQKAATSDATTLPLVATLAEPKPSGTETLGFVDMRAPKKKKRGGRKSTGPVGEGAETSAPPQGAPDAVILPENTEIAQSSAAPVSEPIGAPVGASTLLPEADKDKKNKSKRQTKINKRRSVGSDGASIPAGGTVAGTPAKHVELTIAINGQQPAGVKQTPIPPPNRAILPRPASASASRIGSAKGVPVKGTPTTMKTPSSRVVPASTTPILPPSSVSKLVLQKSPDVAAAVAPILPGLRPKSAAATPLAAISAPNSSSKARKRGPRKSDVSTVTADAPKENKS